MGLTRTSLLDGKKLALRVYAVRILAKEFSIFSFGLVDSAISTAADEADDMVLFSIFYFGCIAATRHFPVEGICT
jgi:hypothetical protein